MSENNNQNILEKYKEDSGLSYSELANLSGVGLTATFRAIKTPWRTSLKTLMKVTRPIKVPEHIVEQFWNEEKKKYYNRIYS